MTVPQIPSTALPGVEYISVSNQSLLSRYNSGILPTTRASIIQYSFRTDDSMVLNSDRDHSAFATIHTYYSSDLCGRCKGRIFIFAVKTLTLFQSKNKWCKIYYAVTKEKVSCIKMPLSAKI